MPPPFAVREEFPVNNPRRPTSTISGGVEDLPAVASTISPALWTDRPAGRSLPPPDSAGSGLPAKHGSTTGRGKDA